MDDLRISNDELVALIKDTNVEIEVNRSLLMLVVSELAKAKVIDGGAIATIMRDLASLHRTKHHDHSATKIEELADYLEDFVEPPSQQPSGDPGSPPSST